MRKLSNWLESYVQCMTSNEAPDIFHLWSAVWALSAAVGRKAWLDFGFFTLYPNMFIVLTGPPASRKTTAAILSNKVVAELDDFALGPDISSKEALLQHMGQSVDEFEYRGVRTKHCSTSIISTEWSTFMGGKDMELCNVMCKLYDCDDSFTKWTKTQGRDKLQNVFLSMLGCSTSTQIGNCLPNAAIGGGFTSRIVFVVGDEEIEKRNPRPKLTPKEKEIKLDLIHDLREIARKIKGPFSFSYGGGIFYDDWYMNRKEQLKIDEKFHHYCDRKPIHVTKLAMLLSVASRTDRVIGAGEIKQAIDLLDAIEPRMPEALGGVGLSTTSPIIASVMQLLRINRKMTVKELQTYLYRDANVEELSVALQTIQNMNVPIVKDADGVYNWTGKG